MLLLLFFVGAVVVDGAVVVAVAVAVADAVAVAVAVVVVVVSILPCNFSSTRLGGMREAIALKTRSERKKHNMNTYINES